MLNILKKLQVKHIDDKKLIINAPFSYLELLNLDDIVFDTNPIKLEYDFIQIFGSSNEELKKLAKEHINLLKDDGLLWLCYPKKTSKKYQSNCSRDTVVTLLQDEQFQAVRQIAIDEDFSGLRFRHESKIK